MKSKMERHLLFFIIVIGVSPRIRCQGLDSSGNETESDLVTCMQEYDLDISISLEDMEEDPDAALDTIIQDMEKLCRIRNGKVETRTPLGESWFSVSPLLTRGFQTTTCSKNQTMGCINNANDNLNKSMDALVFEVMIPENLEVVLDHFCDMVPDLKQHKMCLSMNVYLDAAVAESKKTCYSDLEVELIIFGSLYSNITDPDDSERAIDEGCKKIPSVFNCVADSFASCDATVTSKFRDLGVKMAACCNNPNSINSAYSHLRDTSGVLFLMLSLSLLKF